MLPLNILGITPSAGVPGSSAPKVPVPITAEAVLQVIEDPVIDLLKQLLPLDRPVGSVLEGFRQAITASMTGEPVDDAAGKILTLLRALPVDLKTVTGEQLRSAIDRLGLRYEPMLQAAFAQRAPLSAPQLTAQNLKAALLTLLEAPLPDVSVNGPSPQVQRAGSPAPSQQAQLPQTQSPGNVTAPPQLAAAFTQLVRENLETILLQQLQAQSKALPTPQPAVILPEENATQPRTDSQQSGSPLPQESDLLLAETLLGPDALKPSLQNIVSGRDQDMKSKLLKLLQPLLETSHTGNEREPVSQLQRALTGDDLQAVISSLKNHTSGQKDSLLVDQIRTFAASKLALVEPTESVPSDSAPAGLSSPVAGRQGTDVRQQAHELLTAIERTQVLNSVNSERGEALTFQIPFLLDGRTSTAEFYVERRDEESHKADPEERHYSVIALLDLSELGALRVDLAMHKKHLSVKVTVEREETEALASRLLPEFRQTLSEQGFAVEFLKCEWKNDGSAKGADLRDRTMPSGNELINLRV